MVKCQVGDSRGGIKTNLSWRDTRRLPLDIRYWISNFMDLGHVMRCETLHWKWTLNVEILNNISLQIEDSSDCP